MATYVYTANHETIYTSIPLTAGPTRGTGGVPTVWDWPTQPADGRWKPTGSAVNQGTDNGAPIVNSSSTLVSTSDAILAGHGNPPASLGRNGEFWLDVDTNTLWGPRLNGVWPGTGVTLGGGGGSITLPLAVAQGGTGTTTATAALTMYAGVQGRNPLTGRWHPEAYGAVGDYATDDTTALQACIDACSAAGGGIVQIGRHAVSGSGIHPKTGVTLRGSLGYSKLKNTTSNPAITSNVTCTNITFEDFTIEGTVNEFPTVPKRGRTTSGPGTTIGIWLDGDLDPHNTGLPVITDVDIRRVTINNCSSVPLYIFGVRGRLRIDSCTFYNCKDAATSFCAETIFVNNHSILSADNGFSLARGVDKITCTGNTVELCAYHGIWLSGFAGDTGPVDFSCSGNTVRGCGQAGVLLQDAPVYGNVVGNTIDRQYYRGASDETTDNYTAGILIRGSNATPGTPGSMIAYGLKVAQNTVAGACQAGIQYDGATSVVIEGNLIIDPGTQFYADGTTAITAGVTNQNIGIYCQYPTTVANVIIRNNDIIDSRATPYLNYGMFPLQVAGVTSLGNTMTGARNPVNVPAILDSYRDMRVSDGQSTLPRWAASNLGIGMSSGVLRLAYFNAARNATVTAIRVNSGTTAAGATPTLVQFALYSVDSSGNLTLLSSTANDTSIFSVTSTTYQRNLTTAQAIKAGQTYAIGVMIVTAAATPTAVGLAAAVAGENGLAPMMCSSLSGQSSMPASITAGSVAASQFLLYAVAVGA